MKNNTTISKHHEFSIGLPDTGFLRLPQIIGNPKATPPIPAIIPVGKSTWWAGVKSGIYPKSIKLSERVTVWAVEDIRAYIDNHSNKKDQVGESL